MSAAVKLTSLSPDENYTNQFIVPNGVTRPHFIVIKVNGSTFNQSATDLYQYNFDKNQWIITTTNAKFSDCSVASFDNETKTLYCYDDFNQSFGILKLNDTKFKWEIGSTGIDFGVLSAPIAMKNTCHIIGGAKQNRHIKYDFFGPPIHVFREFYYGFYGHKVILLNNHLFMFGGNDRHTNGYSNQIYKYNIEQNMWLKLNAIMPNALRYFGITTAIDSEYILIFGGYDNRNDKYSDEILIFSLFTQTFTKSNLKSPVKDSPCDAITVDDINNDKKLVRGYIRLRCKFSKSCNYLCSNMLQIIDKYYLSEYVHVIDTEHGCHYKMSTFDIIFNNEQEITPASINSVESENK